MSISSLPVKQFTTNKCYTLMRYRDYDSLGQYLSVDDNDRVWETRKGTPRLNHVWKALAYPGQTDKWFIQSFTSAKMLTSLEQVAVKPILSSKSADISTQQWTVVTPGKNGKTGYPPTISLKSDKGWLKHVAAATTLNGDDTSFEMTMWSDQEFINSKNDEDNWMATLILYEMERCPKEI